MRPSPCERRRPEMRTHGALFLAAVFVLSPLDGIAEEKQIADVKELAGRWQGWITRDDGQEHATLFVSADGSYRALTKDGASTEGKFFSGRQAAVSLVADDRDDFC